MRILVTGFDPFGGESVNSSWEAVRRLPAELAGAEVVAVRLPTSFARSADAVRAAIAAARPDVIVGVGQDGGAPEVRLERIAVNVDHSSMPDNDGDLPVDRTIHDDGPVAYLSSLPAGAMHDALRDAGVAVALSHSAGTFVCNHVFYDVAHLAERELPGVRVGFVHVPFLSEQVVDKPGTPSMALDDIVAALTVALEAIVAA
ncbi:pyroglutamyl-peptidase I [Nocardioides hungaricus]